MDRDPRETAPDHLPPLGGHVLLRARRGRAPGPVPGPAPAPAASVSVSQSEPLPTAVRRPDDAVGTPSPPPSHPLDEIAQRLRLRPRHERLTNLCDLGVVIRWGTLSIVLLEAAIARLTLREIESATLLIVWTVIRTTACPRGSSPRHRLVAASIEAAVCLVAMSLSGGFRSPFVLNLGADVLTTGLDLGLSAVLGILAAVGIAVVARLATDGHPAEFLVAAERAAAILAAGGAGVYARALRTEAGERDGELERLRSVHEVNRLLLELHLQTAGEPSSLSLPGALRETITQLRQFLEPSVLVLLLKDPSLDGDTTTWRTAVAEGAALAVTVDDGGLAPALLAARRAGGLVHRGELAAGEGIGEQSTSGLYAPLSTAGILTGMLAVERDRDPGFSAAEAKLLEEVALHAGLAIDNARLFSRLRSLGADDERGRVARELHDRLGQSLAATSYALDRLAATAAAPSSGSITELHGELALLADDVRAASRHLREQLTDLRADTSAEVSLGDALFDLLARVESRSGVHTELVTEASGRLASAFEHEVWQIAKEAIVNAECHARASRIAVRWHHGAGVAVLEVVDNGIGLGATGPRRRDSYGLVGMRERADAIGAALSVAPARGGGTVVRLRLTDV